MTPLTLFSIGPVKNSPLGKLRLPSLLLRCQLFPAGDRIGIIEEAGVENELFKVAQRHIGVLGGGMCGVECGTPAKGFFLLAPAKCVCNFTHSLPTFGCLCRIDAAHRFRIASCPDSQLR